MIENRPTFKEGDPVLFDAGDSQGKVKGCGIIRGKAVQGVLDFWIIEVIESTIDKKVYPYSCITLSHPLIKLNKLS